ncbi:hypothetical protein MTO96_051056 [Rhipicephalus appendiculatus]
MLSFYDILKESKFALTLVAIALVLSLMFLVFAGAHSVRRCSVKEVSNSFMFLLASFYSTSYSIPRIGRWSRSGGLVCGFWLIDMFKGLIDVHRNLAAAIPSGARDFHIPGVITYWYESFYSKRKGPVMLSFYNILKDSILAVTLVALSLLLCLTFLVFADTDRVRYCSLNKLSNSFMFLLASFYSTSYPMPRVSRWSGLGGLVCGLWLMGMLPFSNYFRGELTSRVAVRGFPDHMDTLAKLERALDVHKVAPCVVKATSLHERLVKNYSIGNLHRKLRLAFETYKKKAKLVKSSYNDCLGVRRGR